MIDGYSAFAPINCGRVVRYHRNHFMKQKQEKREDATIIYAARHYTEWRKADGSVFVEHHRQQLKRRHGVPRQKKIVDQTVNYETL